MLLGAMALESSHDPSLLVAVATVGNVAGALVNWALGFFCAGYADRRWFPLKPKAYARVKSWFKRFGVWTLLFAWLPIMGDPITVAAGLFRVKILPFLVLVTIGKALRYSFIAGAVLTAAGV